MKPQQEYTALIDPNLKTGIEGKVKNLVKSVD